MALSTRASDMLIMAAEGAREDRQKSIENQNATVDSLVNAMQQNRQLGIMQQSANTEESALGIKQQELQIEKMKAEQSSQLLQSVLGGSLGFKSFTSNGMTFENPEFAEKEEERKLTTDARKNLDEYAGNAMQVMDALDRIETQSEELGDFGRGVGEQIAAKASMAVKEFGKDEAVTRYQGTLQRELIPLARKVAEEKGPISEFDVARLEKAFGSLTTPLSDKKFLINEVRGKLKEAIMLKKDLAKLSEPEFEKKYGKLKQKFEGSGKKSALLDLAKKKGLKVLDA